MEVSPLKQKKKQKTLLVVALFIVVIGFVIAYVFVIKGGFISAPSPTEKLQPAGLILEEKLKQVDLDITFLVKNILLKLRTYGDMPVQKGATGKPNPFAK